MSIPLPAYTCRIGTNPDGVYPGDADGKYANLFRTGNGFTGTLDANGCPLNDSGMLVANAFALPITAGTHALQLTGQVGQILNYDFDASTITSQAYNATTNQTTALITWPASITGYPSATVGFTGTKRTAQSTTNDGFTAPYLMRPIYPGATTAHATTEVFSRQYLAALTKLAMAPGLGVIRSLDEGGGADFGAGNAAIYWSNRRLPTEVCQTGGGVRGGMCFEDQILQANLTGSSLHINIPIRSCYGTGTGTNPAIPAVYGADAITFDPTYMTQLCLLMRNGSDATGKVYTNTYQAAGSYPVPLDGSGNPAPVHPSLKYRFEYEPENEVWNLDEGGQGNAYNSYDTVIELATAQVEQAHAAGQVCSLEWDGDLTQSGPVYQIRLLGRFLHDIGQVCESVYGPNTNGVSWQSSLMGSQQDIPGSLQPALDWFTHNAPGLAPRYIGAVGFAFYENFTPSFDDGTVNGVAITVDQALSVGPGGPGTPTDIPGLIAFAKANGIKELKCYEGGLGYSPGSRSAFAYAVAASPKYLRWCRHTIDTCLLLAAQAGLPITLIEYGTCQANWGMYLHIDDVANLPGKFGVYVQAAQDWLANPANGSLTTPLPALASVTAINLAGPLAPLVGGTTAVITGQVVGPNAPLPQLIFSASQSTIDALGNFAVPLAASRPYSVKFTATSAIYAGGVQGSLTLTVPAAIVPAAPPVYDPSWELVSVGDPTSNHSYAYSNAIVYPAIDPILYPQAHPWVFVGSTGISSHSGDIDVSNPADGFGAQVAFFEGVGTISQVVEGCVAGSYTIGFVVCMRAGDTSQPLTVLVDGIVVGTWTPPTTAATTPTPFLTPSFPLTAGNHTLAIQSTSPANQTAIVDAFTFTLVGAVVPPTVITSTSFPSLNRLRRRRPA